MSDTPKQMSIPMAIIIAGALVAVGVYASKATPPAAPVNSGAAVAQAPATPGPLPTHFDIRPVSESDHMQGAVDAPVTIVAFTDLECPYCKVAHPLTTQILDAYKGKVRIVYRHAFIHKQSKAEANAAECAADQGKFWEFADTVFANTNSNDSLNLADLPKYAQESGVADIATFTSCVQGVTHDQSVQADDDEFTALGNAMSQTGRSIGTPFFILEGKDGTEVPIIGAQPYSEFQKTIDSLL